MHAAIASRTMFTVLALVISAISFAAAARDAIKAQR